MEIQDVLNMAGSYTEEFEKRLKEYLQAKGEPLSDCLAKILLEKENAQQERQLTLFDAMDVGVV